MDYHGQIAVVTGASSGLGRRFALDLAEAGAVVIGVARRAELLESLCDQMRPKSFQSCTVECDVSDVPGFARMLGGIEDEWGRIDILINNAGIGQPRSDHDDVAAQRLVMETNYFAPVAGTLAVLPGMRARRHGVIVNVSSDSGRAPSPQESAYGPSKSALSAFTESMAFATDGSGVHLHVLYPGWVPTPMGSAAVDHGMPTPPKMMRRSEEQVSQLLLSRMGGPKVDIDATLLARLAPAVRSLVPGLYRRGVRRFASAGDRT